MKPTKQSTKTFILPINHPVVKKLPSAAKTQFQFCSQKPANDASHVKCSCKQAARDAFFGSRELLTMKRLETTVDNLALYYAGLPSFTRNFSRDSLISGIILEDPKILSDQITFSLSRQGKRKNRFTGEERGKIHHEYPGVIVNGLSTEYNACDTNALLLIAMNKYVELTGDRSILSKNILKVGLAVDYILTHIKDGLFQEDPSFCGAKNFALDTTYWKDAQFVGKPKAKYPVMYTLAHIQNLAGIRSAARLLYDETLDETADRMLDAIKDKLGYIAVDAEDKIESISSDILQALFYLEKEDLSPTELETVVKASKRLETVAGYRTLDPNFRFELYPDSYDYPNTVWPFEQALIHMGARKFNLPDIEAVSARVDGYLKSEPEYLIVEGTTSSSKVKGAGCDPQLWTIAAKEYFRRIQVYEQEKQKDAA